MALRPDDQRLSQFGKLKLRSLRAEGDVAMGAKLGNDDWIDCGCIEWLLNDKIMSSKEQISIKKDQNFQKLNAKTNYVYT